MKPIELRPHQINATELARAGFASGHNRQIVVMPTGAGKSIYAADLMQKAADRGTRTAFVVDRISLVDQTSAVFDEYGIDHGVIQAGHWRYRPYLPIQVCSAQTLERRNLLADMDIGLMVYDECHAARKALIDVIKSSDAIKVIGLTATPFTKGLGEVYSNVISPVTTNELIEQGFLCPLKYFAAQSIDMTGAKVVAGEWAASEIEARGTAIMGDIVSTWVSKTHELFGGPVKTIVFSATVAHGEDLCRRFAAAGYNFQQISYLDADDDARREKIAEFRKPNSAIDGLISVEVLSRGFDVPDVRIGIGARPFRKSFSAHIQAIGRVMRSSPGKDFGVWLDHSGNLHRFWADMQYLFSHGVTELEDGRLKDAPRKEPTAEKKEAMACANCKIVLPPRSRVCLSCGHERRTRSLVEEASGAIVEIDGKTVKLPAFMTDRNLVWRQLVGVSLGRKVADEDARRRWCQAKFRSWYGEFARKTWSATDAIDPSDAVLRKIRADNIRYAKRRQAA